MRIGIFAVMAGRNAAGLERYELGLLRSIAEADKCNEYHVFCTDRRAVDAIDVAQDNIAFHVLWPGIRPISITFALPIMQQLTKVEVLHATFVPPPLVTKPLVFTLHDTSMFEHPEFLRRSHVSKLSKLVRIGLDRSKIIVCISEHSRKVVLETFPVPAEKLCVVYPGVGSQFRPLSQQASRQFVSQKYRLERPYILFVGQLRTRSKNLPRLLEAFQMLSHEHKLDLDLVLAGRRCETSVGLDEAIASISLRDRVIELGHVPDHDLPYLYSGAEMLAFPSLSEGFGFPLVEAMACGTPVVASNITSLPEIAGNCALLVNPFSVQDIVAGMHRILTDLELNHRLRQSGQLRAQSFSWSSTAQGMIEAYRQALMS